LESLRILLQKEKIYAKWLHVLLSKLLPEGTIIIIEDYHHPFLYWEDVIVSVKDIIRRSFPINSELLTKLNQHTNYVIHGLERLIDDCITNKLIGRKIYEGILMCRL